MPITVEELLTGDVNYISKHNANYDTIKSAIDALQLQQTGSATSVVNFPAFAQAMLGVAVGKLEILDAVATDGGSAILDITAGSIWIPAAGRVSTGAPASLDFTGQSTDTYYTHIDSVGAWSFDTSSTNAVHTIAFTSPSTFTTITEPVVVWGNDVFQTSKTSAALGATYDELDLRLEAAENSTNGFFTTAITVSDVTLTTAEGMENKVLETTGTLTGNRDLIVPTLESNWLVVNNTAGAFDMEVRTDAGLGVVVPQGGSAWVYCDGTDVILGLTFQGAAATAPYIMASFKNSVPASSERVLGHSFPDIDGLATEVDLTASSVEAETAATAETDFDILKNDVSFGTIRFAISGTVASFVSVTAQTFVQGDRLEIIAPGTPDATLADIYFTIAGTRDA